MDKNLKVEMSWWEMNSLAGTEGEAESAGERCRLIAEHGFDGINGFLPAEENAAEWRRLLAHYGLSFSVNAYPASLADMDEFLKKAKSYEGTIDYINAQVMQPFLVGDEAVRLLAGIDRLSREAGIPVFVETHRGTITQDLIRTVEYAQALPSLRLTIDYSHYVVAGELHTVTPQAEEWLGKLLPHTASIHARVSNGEQVQIDPGFGEDSHPMLAHFARWWSAGMLSWRERSGHGTDALPFVVELGPPPYAITAGDGREISDRWRQSLELQRLARRLWAELGA
ncbi:sugar phosphate isomerase/epimerase family protein [Paenibacillus thailandensis]|uniref:Sugar phosphate isomerase/epimerase family protein n=1 Tax=Paenibacillus thailandensis TaxID=393250 RepID=A0ABW5R6Y5_9BACL